MSKDQAPSSRVTIAHTGGAPVTIHVATSIKNGPDEHQEITLTADAAFKDLELTPAMKITVAQPKAPEPPQQ